MILICGKVRPPPPCLAPKCPSQLTLGKETAFVRFPSITVNDKVLSPRHLMIKYSFHDSTGDEILQGFKTFVRCYSPYLCPAGKLTSFSLILEKLTSLQTEQGPQHNFWHFDFLKFKTKQNKTSTAFHKCQKGRERYEKNISANGPPMLGIS